MKHTVKLVLKSLGVMLIIFLWWFFFYEPDYTGSVTLNEGSILTFAHRGFGGYMPDNALRSAVFALENGYSGVDVDGQLSKDGVPVIYHDLSVDRLTTGSGRVAELSAEELLSLDLGPKHSSTTSGYMVETFEIFVKETKGKGILMVELKVPSAAATGFEEKVVDIIKKYNRLEDVYLSSFNPIVLWRLEHIDSRVQTAMIFMDTNWNPALLAEIRPEDRVDLPWFLQQEWIRRGIRKVIKPDLLSVNHEVDEDTIKRLVAKGWPIFLWTPNAKDTLERAVSFKPYGIISDEVFLLKEVTQ